jgi:hypothetical protein
VHEHDCNSVRKLIPHWHKAGERPQQ